MLREANADELQQLLELYLDLHETSVPEQTESVRKTWEKILADPDHHVIVYEENGLLLSSCICVVIPNLTRGVRPYALIENVVTRADARGRGLATQCLNYARDTACRENCYKIMLLTGAKDRATLQFYRNAGYADEEKTAFIMRLK